MFFKYTREDIPDIGLRHVEVRDGRVTYTPVVAGSVAEGARVLLCLHGITADTRSIVQLIGTRLQQDLGYDHLLAFDYESFTTRVRDNANTLWAALHDAGVRADRNVQLDIVAHSMGGLVARALVELEQGGALVRRLVMAGTPNGGSPLANAARFGLAIGSFALGAAVPGALSKVAAWGLNWLRDQAVGLADLQTGSELVKALKNGRRPDSVRYLALAGTYVPTDPQAQQSIGVFNRILDSAFDQFLKDSENDLIVAAGSVLSVQPDCDKIIKPACNHSGYFSDTTLASYYQQLHDWLAA
jgi:pimeloyl-ACP methyl ester carboxylesterase